MTGPTLQPELIDDALIRFRQYKIIFCADIKKMYRQILIHPDNRRFQHILWRLNPSESIQHFKFNTVIYGTVPASYLATKCLSVLGDSIQEENQNAATAIKSHSYMDDLMSGAENIESALNFKRVVHAKLLSAGFPLRKYQSNSNDFLKGLDSHVIEKLPSQC